MCQNNPTRTVSPVSSEGGETTIPDPSRETMIPAPGRDVLAEILHDGAQRLLVQAIEAEVGGWIEQHASLTNHRGHQQVGAAPVEAGRIDQP